MKIDINDNRVGGAVIVAYAVVALLVYGSISGPMSRYDRTVYEDCLKVEKERGAGAVELFCYKTAGPEYLGALIAGMFWPIYVPLHIATKLFE